MSGERGTSAIHEAGSLAYDPRNLRDLCWPRMRRSLREQIKETVGGQIVEWWANRYNDGTLTAVVLGPAGLCHAVPAGKREHTLRTVRFAPRSLWVMTSGSPVDLPEESVTAIASGSVPLPADSLPEDIRGLLGNLPASTQLTLQELFGPGANLAHNYYYEVSTSKAQTTWRFLCYLADDTTLTFGSGTKVTSGGADDAAVWEVTCYRATVIEPMPPSLG
jgi:hypothetical protein